MEVNREIIIDLLPVYFSGEASASTRTLMEDYFRDDPEFERIARNANRSVDSLKIEAISPNAEKEKQSLMRTRDHLRARNIWMGFAIAYCLFPFSFAFTDNHLTWFMLRDSPRAAIMFATFGIVCWAMFFVHNRRIKKAGIS